jgi:predicted transcriptional regulator
VAALAGSSICLLSVLCLWQTDTISNKDTISEDISRRIDALTARSSLTRGQIIEDALAHGRSLAWHERWVAGVQEGLAEAERGKFATEAEIAAVLTKYGPA